MLRFVAPLAIGALGVGAIATSAGLATAAGAGASSKPTYTIGYEGPLSGGDAQDGINEKFGVEVAINQANAGKTFGSLPFKLKYAEADDQGSPTQSPTAAESLITNSNVVAVVGPAFSGATAAAEPEYNQASLATVSPSATNATLQTEGWKTFFRVVPDDDVQGPADAEFIAKVLKYTNIETVDDASTYGAGLIQAVDGELTTLGVKFTHTTAPSTTQCANGGTGDVSEYPSLATEIKSANPQMVFYGGYYCDFALFAVQLRDAGYTGQLMSGDGSFDPHYISEAGPKVADYSYLSCPCDTSPTGAAAKAFATEFQKLAGFPVAEYSAEAYDATNVIIDVMKSLNKVTRAAIVTGLHKVTWVGLTKTIKFEANGNVAGNAIDIYRVRGGKYVLLGLVPDLIKAAKS